MACSFVYGMYFAPSLRKPGDISSVFSMFLLVYFGTFGGFEIHGFLSSFWVYVGFPLGFLWICFWFSLGFLCVSFGFS